MSLYTISHYISKPLNEKFMLHSHDTYELLYFFKGDCDYIVEGAVYPLEPHSMIIIRPNEMHRLLTKTNTEYERLVCNISEEFFSEMQCDEYRRTFIDHNAGTKNKLNADIVEKSGISLCFERLEKYSGGYKDMSSPVIRSIIIEILHILNHTDMNDSPATNRVQEIIAYINNNFKEEISLSSIADAFFISKSHLAREFHAATGYTVNSYINRKRINEAISLKRSGKSFGAASFESGFSDYTSFYRAFSKQLGCSPKDYFKLCAAGKELID